MGSPAGFTGAGTATYPNGDTYTGDFKDGKKSGQGVYTSAGSGDKYTGGYLADVRSGVGKLDVNTTVTPEEGAEPVEGPPCFYHGEWSNGKRHGEGTFVYANGDVYCGGWSQGRKSGFGEYTFAESKYSFRGEWVEGQIITGEWVLSEKMIYNGPFKRQKPCGLNGKWIVKTGNYTIYGKGKTDTQKKLANPGYEVRGCYTQEVVPVDDGPAGSSAVKLAWQTFGVVKAKPNAAVGA